MEKMTPEKVLAIVEAQRESDEPDAILAVFKEHDGKPFTKRILAKLPGGEERWRISLAHGMAHLETREYARTQGNSGMSLLVAYDEKNVKIDAAWLEEHNACYFSARVVRNKQRGVLMRPQSRPLLAKMALALNSVDSAREALADAEAMLAELTEFPDGPFAADRFTFKAIADGKDGGK